MALSREIRNQRPRQRSPSRRRHPLAGGETPSRPCCCRGRTEALGVGRGLAAWRSSSPAILAALSPRITIAGRVPLDKPPAVLADRAQQILASLGYTDPVADSADGFAVAMPFMRWAAANDARPQRWDILKTGSPPALVFWHRTSPRLLVPQRSQPQVTTADPPLAVSGMTLLMVDTLGRMIEFQAVPSQFESDPARQRHRGGRHCSTLPASSSRRSHR
jgi:hypothetical protein